MAQGSLDKPDTGVVAVAGNGRKEMRQLFVDSDKLKTNWVKTPGIKWNGSKNRTGEEGRRGSLKI